MNAKLSSTMWRLERCFGMPAFGSYRGRTEGVAANGAVSAAKAADHLSPQYIPTVTAVSLI